MPLVPDIAQGAWPLRYDLGQLGSDRLLVYLGDHDDLYNNKLTSNIANVRVGINVK